VRTADNEPFKTREQAERFAQERNDSVWRAIQTYRVFRLEKVAFAKVTV
jgi:hypothetical protein